MHELSIIEDLSRKVETLAKQHKASRVVRLVLEINVESHLASEHLQETFVTFRGASPLLQDTEIEFRKSEGIQGDEILLRDVELEVP